MFFIGDVVLDQAVTNAIAPGLQLLAFPYSASIPLNDTGLTNGLAGSAFASADRVITWEAESQQFKRFYLRADANPQFDRKWIDTSVEPNAVATNSLSVGQGFWYERMGTNAFQWVEFRPYPGN
jgi:hypothetical protein